MGIDSKLDSMYKRVERLENIGTKTIDHFSPIIKKGPNSIIKVPIDRIILRPTPPACLEAVKLWEEYKPQFYAQQIMSDKVQTCQRRSFSTRPLYGDQLRFENG